MQKRFFAVVSKQNDTYMSTEIIPQAKTRPMLLASESIPLESGDRLTRSEFHRRYTVRDDLKKAELIEGVVYVASPVRYEQHGKPHATIITWLGTYLSETPGIGYGDNTTVFLDNENEVQPDAFLRLEREFGGRSEISSDDYITGPPELIIEVAASSAAYDMYDKRRVYARNGVQEYIAIQIYEKRIDWFVLHDGSYETLQAPEEGLLMSEVFPGLWLDTQAFWKHDLAGMLTTLRRGLASEAHTSFLQDRLKKSAGSSDHGPEIEN